MENVVKKKHQYEVIDGIAYPIYQTDSDSVVEEESVGSLANSLADSLTYLKDIIYWIPNKADVRKDAATFELYKKLKINDEDESLSEIQKLTNSLELLQLILFGKLLKTF